MSTIKISTLTSSGAILGNVLVPVVGNVAGTLTTLKSTVDQLKTFITAGTEANVLASNAATIFANTIMKGYVDGQITAANAGVTAANVGIIGYVDLANTIQTSQISAANLGMKGYVDSVASQSIYGNVNVKAYTETMGFSNFSNVNVAAYVTTANSAIIGYIDLANSIQSQQLVDANISLIGIIGLGNSITRAYIDGQISAANAGVTAANVGMLGLVQAVIDAVTVANSIQANLLANLGAIDLTTINAALGVHTGQISALDANAAVQAGNIAELFANAAAQAVLISSLGNTQQIEANISTLQSNAATQSDLIIGINANVSSANIGIKGYVDSRITLANTGITTANTGMLGYVDSRITVANAGVTAANVGIIGYVDLANTIQSAQITAANLGIIGYINLSNTIQSAQIDTLTSNAATQGANINTLLSSVGTLTGQLSEANLGLKGYVDLANTIQSGQVGAANLAITAANVGMKGYVDNQTYSNVQVAIFTNLSTYAYNANVTAANLGMQGYVNNAVSTANIGMKGYVDNAVATSGYSNVQVATFLPTYSGNIANVRLGASGVLTLPHGATIRDTVNDAVAVGYAAGVTTQGNNAVAFGTGAGNDTQGTSAVAIGANAGYITQGTSAVAIGAGAGQTSQGTTAVAIGAGAGDNTQGNAAVAVGYQAGTTNQGNNSIIINATGVALENTTADTFTVAPIRNDVANVGQVVFYNTTSKEITYGNVISVAGNVSAGNVSVPGTSGKIGFSSGGFAQQATSNATQVTSHFTSGNIQLMSIDLGASAAHTVSFSCNKLTTNDILVVKHVSGGVTSVYVDAYVQSDGLANIWMRDITGNGTGAFTPMLKYAIIRAPSA